MVNPKELEEKLRSVEKIESLPKDYKGMLENGKSAEKRGREIAALHREKTPDEAYSYVVWWSIDLLHASQRASDIAKYLPRDWDGRDTMRWIADVFDKALKAGEKIHDIVKYVCEASEPLESCSVSKKTIERIRELEETVKKRTGRRCTWLLGVKEPYTVTAAINDVTACFHRALEVAEEIQPKVLGQERGYKKLGWRCRVFPNTPKRIADACLDWEEALVDLDEYGLLAKGDLDPTLGIAEEGELSLRVGSSEGHLAHLDLEKGRLEYYDMDENVNRVMKALLERYADLDCEIMREGDEEIGVLCTGLDGNLRVAARIMAAATSMDFRLEGEFDEEEETDALKKIDEKCERWFEEWREESGLDRDEEILEFCRISKILSLG